MSGQGAFIGAIQSHYHRPPPVQHQHYFHAGIDGTAITTQAAAAISSGHGLESSNESISAASIPSPLLHGHHRSTSYHQARHHPYLQHHHHHHHQIQHRPPQHQNQLSSSYNGNDSLPNQVDSVQLVEHHLNNVDGSALNSPTSPYQVGCGAAAASTATPSSTSASALALPPLPFRPAHQPVADLPAHYNLNNVQVQVADTHAQHHFARAATLRMAAFAHQDDELAQLQALSNNWEPEPEGPLVSHLLDSSALTTEYAEADPIYQQKTANLPQTYAHYRTCRGDGHCGWRAVAFCYYEILARLGDLNKIQEEISRMKSLQNVLNGAGFEEHVYEDFADDAFNLLGEVPSGIEIVLSAFNDANRSMSIITYLKLLTSAWMQRYPEQYESFVSEPIQSYCQSYIEPAICEIDDVGMSALIDVLIKPAGLAVEILYLDRSAGTEVNAYRHAPDDSPSYPTIRLLYRPGHYDILYKAEDVLSPASSVVPTPTTQQNVFVGIAHHTPEVTHHQTPYQPAHQGHIEIPGTSFYNGPGSGWSQHGAYSQYSTVQNPIPPLNATTVAHRASIYTEVPPREERIFVTTIPARNRTKTMPARLPRRPPVHRWGPFRPSAYEFETVFAPRMPPLPPFCQTAIFRNSHYNTAHFQNPDFEPEQYIPGTEYGIVRPRPRNASQ